MLSVALITVEGATGSSPGQALLFRNGNYVGTATSKAYSFMNLNAARTTDDTVALSYKQPQPPGCGPCGGRRRWTIREPAGVHWPGCFHSFSRIASSVLGTRPIISTR
jgi:LppP/LprE lipoprotein